MLDGLLPGRFSIDGIAGWLLLAAGLTIGVSLAGAIFKPLEDAMKSKKGGK